MTTPTHSHKHWTDKGGHVNLRPLIPYMATLALNSGLWVRRFLIGGSPI